MYTVGRNWAEQTKGSDSRYSAARCKTRRIARRGKVRVKYHATQGQSMIEPLQTRTEQAWAVPRFAESLYSRCSLGAIGGKKGRLVLRPFRSRVYQVLTPVLRYLLPGHDTVDSTRHLHGFVECQGHGRTSVGLVYCGDKSKLHSHPGSQVRFCLCRGHKAASEMSPREMSCYSERLRASATSG